MEIRPKLVKTRDQIMETKSNTQLQDSLIAWQISSSLC